MFAFNKSQGEYEGKDIRGSLVSRNSKMAIIDHV